YILKSFRSFRVRGARLFPDSLHQTVDDASTKISREQRPLQIFKKFFVRSTSEESIQGLLHDIACSAEPFAQSLKPSHRQRPLVSRPARNVTMRGTGEIR